MAFAFEKLQVYQKAVAFADSVCTLTKSFSRGYFFLADQLNRAALPIAANIAEGNGRFTKRREKREKSCLSPFLRDGTHQLPGGNWDGPSADRMNEMQCCGGQKQDIRTQCCHNGRLVELSSNSRLYNDAIGRCCMKSPYQICLVSNGSIGGLHRSVCIVNRSSGRRSCYSYGLDNSLGRFSLLSFPQFWDSASVYKDYESMAFDIETLRCVGVNKEDGEFAIQMLEGMLDTRGPYGLTYGNCRQFSQEMISALQSSLNSATTPDLPECP